jgi:hypothetical protein
MRNAATDSREVRSLGLHHTLRVSGTISSQIALVREEVPETSALQAAGARSEVDRILTLVGEVMALWHDAPSNPQTGSIFRDALEFAGSLPASVALPRVWFDECEVVFEWIEQGRHAVVSCEGDGIVGYTYRVDGMFKPGAIAHARPHSFPADLTDYLIAG